MIFSISFVSSACTLTFDSTDYVEGEIVDVDGICNTGNEKSQDYTLNWTNLTGYQLELDIGTTPSTFTLFSETFTIPSGYVATYGSALNVTINGTNLEGTYTMRCTAIDRFFGEDAVQATANFKVLSGFPEEIFGKVWDRIKKALKDGRDFFQLIFFLVCIGAVFVYLTCGIFIYKKKAGEKIEWEYQIIY